MSGSLPLSIAPSMQPGSEVVQESARGRGSAGTGARLPDASLDCTCSIPPWNRMFERERATTRGPGTRRGLGTEPAARRAAAEVRHLETETGSAG